jgi:hypothetical protein
MKCKSVISPLGFGLGDNSNDIMAGTILCSSSSKMSLGNFMASSYQKMVI